MDNDATMAKFEVLYYIMNITNKNILRRLNKQMEIAFTIKKRKMRYLLMACHEKYNILQLVLHGKTDNKKGILTTCHFSSSSTLSTNYVTYLYKLKKKTF